MTYSEWRDAELQELRETLRSMGFTPDFTSHLSATVCDLMDVAHDMEFEDVVHED